MRCAAAVIAFVVMAAFDTPLVAAAEPRANKLPRIGVLEPGLAPGASCLAAFHQGMRDLGYIDGKTVAIDLRYADNSTERLKTLAAEIVRQAPCRTWTRS